MAELIYLKKGSQYMSNKLKVYVKSILIPLIVGGIVGLLISSSIDYNVLQKPKFSPPSILFPIMWTILYVIMGISYGILKNNLQIDKKTNIIYYVQLFVNALWSIIFFTLKWRLFAFVWILILALLIIFMIVEFYKKNKLAGILQIPYLLWVLFASYLNVAIYALNK